MSRTLRENGSISQMQFIVGVIDTKVSKLDFYSSCRKQKRSVGKRALQVCFAEFVVLFS